MVMFTRCFWARRTIRMIKTTCLGLQVYLLDLLWPQQQPRLHANIDTGTTERKRSFLFTSLRWTALLRLDTDTQISVASVMLLIVLLVAHCLVLFPPFPETDAKS